MSRGRCRAGDRGLRDRAAARARRAGRRRRGAGARAALVFESRGSGARGCELRRRVRRAAPRCRRGGARAQGRGRLPEDGVAERDRVAVVGTAEGTRWTARMPEGRDSLLQVVARLQGKLQGEMVREAMTEYEAMRIDQDRDPIVTDRVMRRFLASGQIRQDSRLPRDPAPDPNDVESFRASLRRGRPTSTHGPSREPSSPWGSSSVPWSPSPRVRGASRSSSSPAGSSRIRAWPSTARSAPLRAARTRPSTSSTSAALVAAPTGTPGGRRDTRQLDRREHGRRPGRGPRAERGERGAGRRHRRIRDHEPERPRGRPRSGSGAKHAATTWWATRRRTGRRTGGSARSRSRSHGRASASAHDGATTRRERTTRRPWPRRATPRSRGRSTRRSTSPAIPLRALAYVLGEAWPGKAKVLLTAEADIRGFALRRARGDLPRRARRPCCSSPAGTTGSTPDSTSSSR